MFRAFEQRTGGCYVRTRGNAEICEDRIAGELRAAGRFARRLDLPRLPPGGFQQQVDFLHAALQPLSDDLSYRAFLGATLLSHALAHPAADLTLDMDLLSQAAQYRESARSAIFERTGLSVSFDDCRLGAHDATRVGFDLAAAGSDVLRILRSCGVECSPDVLT